MTLVGIGARNITRNRTRTLLTVLGAAIAILAFITLRTLLSMWDQSIETGQRDRLATRHKVTFIMQLPMNYIDTIRRTPGVKAATWQNWFGGRDPRRPREFFQNVAVDAESFLEVLDEFELSAADRERWLADRKGAIVGDQLAKKLGLKVGDVFTLEGSIYPGTWPFTIDGIYTTRRKAVDRSSLFFHYKLLNESLPPERQGEIGWVISRIDDPSRSAEISAAIDRVFAERDTQTVTMSERAMNLSFMAGMSAILKGLDIVSGIILLIMMLILGNTIAMGVRERTQEYGVLRALGFLPRHIASFVLSEALVVGVLGGAVGLALAYPLVHFGLGRWLEENMGAFFPRFRIDLPVAALAMFAAALIGVVASLIPAWQASKLKVVDALRRVG
jgi:putative ABC transport system permease protein